MGPGCLEYRLARSPFYLYFPILSSFLSGSQHSTMWPVIEKFIRDAGNGSASAGYICAPAP